MRRPIWSSSAARACWSQSSSAPFPVREIPRLIQEGRINHALCVAGLLWWLRLGPSGAPAPPDPAANPEGV